MLLDSSLLCVSSEAWGTDVVRLLADAMQSMQGMSTMT